MTSVGRSFFNTSPRTSFFAGGVLKHRKRAAPSPLADWFKLVFVNFCIGETDYLQGENRVKNLSLERHACPRKTNGDYNFETYVQDIQEPGDQIPRKSGWGGVVGPGAWGGR